MAVALAPVAAQPIVWCFTYSSRSGVDEIFVRWLSADDTICEARILHCLLDDGRLWVPAGQWPAEMDQTTRDELRADVESYQLGSRWNVARVEQVEGAVLK